MRTVCDLIDLLARSRFYAAAAARTVWPLAFVMAFGATLGWLPTPAFANATLATESRATAALDFAIIVPSILRILENSHPSSLVFGDSGASPHSSVTQKIVLISTLHTGFCIDLRMAETQVANWQMRLAGNTSVRMETTDGGYRLCVRRAGRYELALEHDFVLKSPLAGNTSAGADRDMVWPVNVSLASP